LSARFGLPKYCLHKPTGRAYVHFSGRVHYLAEFDSPESKARYREHARGYFRKDGKPTGEISWVESACRFLMAHCRRRAVDFGPLALEALRIEMVAAA